MGLVYEIFKGCTLLFLLLLLLLLNYLLYRLVPFFTIYLFDFQIHDDDDEPDQLPEFTNLKHLEFTLGNKDYYYDLFEAYIEACPCLETIVLKVCFLF